MGAPSYIPAPTKATRILGPDGFPLTGDVTVLPGNSQAITRQGNGLLVSAAASKRSRALEIFVPGVMTARTVLVALGVPDAVLAGIDAYFKTAPGAGTDVNNYASLHITGGSPAPGPIDFPFNVNGQNEWHLGMDSLSQALGGNGIPFATGPGVAPDRGSGGAARFHPTANITVGGMGFAGFDASRSVLTAGPLRVGLAADFAIADAVTGTNTPWLTCSNGAPAYVDVPMADVLPSAGGAGATWTVIQFPGTVPLVSGTKYHAIVFNLDSNSTFRFVDGIQNWSPGNATGNVANETTAGSQKRTNSGDAIHPPYGLPATWDSDAGAAGQVATFKLYGSVIGTPLAMPATVAITITGAPANPGSDLMVSLQF